MSHGQFCWAVRCRVRRRPNRKVDPVDAGQAAPLANSLFAARTPPTPGSGRGSEPRYRGWGCEGCSRRPPQPIAPFRPYTANKSGGGLMDRPPYGLAPRRQGFRPPRTWTSELMHRGALASRRDLGSARRNGDRPVQDRGHPSAWGHGGRSTPSNTPRWNGWTLVRCVVPARSSAHCLS